MDYRFKCSNTYLWTRTWSKTGRVLTKRTNTTGDWNMWHRDGLGDDFYILLNTTAVRNGSTDWFRDLTQQLLHHIGSTGNEWISFFMMLRDTQGWNIFW